MIGTAVHPIAQHIYNKGSGTVKQHVLKLADFEFEGGYPYKEYKFSDGKPGIIIGQLFSLNLDP